MAIEKVCADVKIFFDGVLVAAGSAQKFQFLEAQEKSGPWRYKDLRSNSEAEVAGSKLKLSLAHFQLKTERDAFPSMIKHAFYCEESSRISLRGVAHVSARTPLGALAFLFDLGDAHRLRINVM